MSTKPKKRNVKIRLKTSAQVQKKDKTNVARPDTTRYQRVQGRPPADVGATFRVKIRRK